MVPQLPWLERGPRPLLSYQTAEDGVSTKCSPSYGIRAGLNAGGTNSSAETVAMTAFLLRGITVIAPDYEGPRSEFTGVGMAAHGVLDGIRAAKAFAPARIDARAPVGMMGYSGGALATSLAAQLQSGYAPELKLAGIMLGGVVADLRATLKAFSGSPLGGALAIGLVGADRSYPQQKVRSYLNAAGNRALDASQDDCINDAVIRHPFAKIEDWQARPGLIDDPGIVKLMRDISPLGVPGTPTAPVLGYHTILDELAPIGPARQLYNRYCRAGVRVTRIEDPAGEHVTGVATGAAQALLWMADRFARRRAPISGPVRKSCGLSDGCIVVRGKDAGREMSPRHMTDRGRATGGEAPSGTRRTCGRVH